MRPLYASKCVKFCFEIAKVAKVFFVWNIVYHFDRKTPAIAGGCSKTLLVLCRSLKDASFLLGDTASAMLDEHIKLIEKTVLNLREVSNSLSLCLSLWKIRHLNAMKSLMKSSKNTNTQLRNKSDLILQELKV